MRKNGFLTFCFSFIPGAGQMYQGYMKRGLSIMIIFAIFMGISIIISAPIFTIPLPIIFAYSFFDTFNVRSKINAGIEYKDEYIWNNFLDSNILDSFKEKKGNNIIAGILILFGIYILLNNVVGQIAYRADLYFISEFINNITRYLPAGLIAAISIYGGIKLISKNK